MGIGNRLNNFIGKSTMNDEALDMERNQNNDSHGVKNNEGTNKIVFTSEEPKYGLSDVILPESVKEQILDVIEYKKNSEKVFGEWGLGKTHKYSKKIGVNLYGPSGTGKTMVAHAIAKYLDRKIMVVNYADIESKYVGETPKNIKAAFEYAKETKSILFFDEADAILSRRVTDMQRAVDVSVNQTRSVLLMLLNDYQDFIIFATNFIENFDPAFMRRIARHVKFELPDEMCRKKLWQMYIPNQMPNNIDIENITVESEGLSGSDIANAILTAAFKAARNGKKQVENKFVIESIENIKESKTANSRRGITTTKKIVSEEYAKEQLGKNNRR